MTNQTCRMCNKEKELKFFSKNKDAKNGRDNRCKLCMRKYKNNKSKKASDALIFESIDSMAFIDKDIPNINNKDWQGGKYKGTVIKKENAFRASVSGQYKQYGISIHGEKEAKKLAFKWKKEKSDELLETKNKYKIIFEGTKPVYVVVQLSKNFVTLIDYDDLDHVRKINLSIKGSETSKETKYALGSANNALIPLHRLIKGLRGKYDKETIIDHINRYSLDNRKENLRIVGFSENNKNRCKVGQTRLSRNKDTQLYKATIEYCPRIGESNEISEYFKKRSDATQWIEDKRRELDGHEKLSDMQKRLTDSYEKIMKEHAGDFIWRDVIREETIKKSKEAAEKKADMKTHNKIINGRKGIYDKFLQIDPDIDTLALAKLGPKIVHQTHKNKEYKYCSGCEQWLDVCNYGNLKKNWDKLDKTCKACRAKKRATKPNDWKDRNKDKVKEYNKMYRQKNAEKIKQKNEANRVPETDKLEKKNKRRQLFWDKFVKLVEDKGATVVSTIDDYQTAHSKLKMKCANGTDYEATWNNLSRGKWCNCCK